MIQSKLKIFIIQISIFFSILLVVAIGGELILRIAARLRESCWLPPQTKLDAVICGNNSNKNVFPYFLSSWFYHSAPLTIAGKEVIPLSGVPLRDTVFCNEQGPWETFTSDRYGFSNPDSVWEKNEVDALILGDSFLLGECVPLASRPAEVIRSKIPNTINLGYSGSGPLTELARLREYSISLRPKNILFFYFEQNDPDELCAELRVPLFRRYLEESNFTQNLQSMRLEVGRNAESRLLKILEYGDMTKDVRSWSSFFQLSNVHRYLEKAWYERQDRSPPSLDQMDEDCHHYPASEFLRNMEKVLNRINAIANEKKSKVYFVYLPGVRAWHREYKTPLIEITKKLGIQFVDAEDFFRIADVYPFSGSVPNHYNAHAYTILGQEISKLLEKAKAL